LNGLKIQQSHFYTDVKLALGYTAVIISGACFAWDFKLGFEKTMYWTAAAVAVYFALNGAFTYWLWFVEKDVVFTGNWNGQQLIISTKTKKHDPLYRLTARYTSPNSSTLKEMSIEAPVMRWFTADGFFIAKPFQQWLASSIPLIGQLDPTNASETGAQSSAQEQTIDPSVLQAALDGFATGTKPSQGGKKRKG